MVCLLGTWCERAQSCLKRGPAVFHTQPPCTLGHHLLRLPCALCFTFLGAHTAAHNPKASCAKQVLSKSHTLGPSHTRAPGAKHASAVFHSQQPSHACSQSQCPWGKAQAQRVSQLGSFAQQLTFTAHPCAQCGLAMSHALEPSQAQSPLCKACVFPDSHPGALARLFTITSTGAKHVPCHLLQPGSSLARPLAAGVSCRKAWAPAWIIPQWGSPPVRHVPTVFHPPARRRADSPPAGV